MSKTFSIIILSMNHLDSTLRLLNSLHSTNGDYETLVIDNGSETEVSGMLQKIEESPLGSQLSLKCFFNSTNIGIASGRNQGADQATGEILVFLDNDTVVVSPDWLEQIDRVYRGHTNLGTVGGVLLNPDRTIQFAGGTIDSSAHVKFNTELTPGLEITETMFSLGACLSTPLSCWEQLGGFDKQFDPMDYEDIDYCLRASSAGFPSYICQRCLLVHEAHTTTRTGTAGFARLRQYLRSGSRFLKKWRSTLATPQDHLDRKE